MILKLLHKLDFFLNISGEEENMERSFGETLLY